MAPDGKAPEAAAPKSVFDRLKDLFTSTVDKARTDSVLARQKIKPDETLLALANASEENESIELNFEAQYELGDANLDNPKTTKSSPTLPTLEDGRTYRLMGSVDRETFDINAKRAGDVDKVSGLNFYSRFAVLASEFTDFSEHIEANFDVFRDPVKAAKMMKIIEAMMYLPSNPTDADWKNFVKTNGYTKEEIYGPEGALNILLSFDRATKSVDGLDIEDFKQKDEKTPPKFLDIRLDIAAKPGARREARYTKLVSTKLKEKTTTKPPVEPEKKPPVDPKKKPPEDPKKKPPEPDKSKEGVDEVKIGIMDKQLRDAGFEIVYQARKIGESAYLKLGKKRLLAKYNADSSFTYTILTLKDGWTAEQTKTVPDAKTIKANLVALDARSPAASPSEDTVRRLYSDFQNVPKYREHMTMIDATGTKIGKFTFEKKHLASLVTVKGAKFIDASGAQKGPFDAKFIMTINEVSEEYKLYDSTKGTVIDDGTDAAKLIEGAIKEVYPGP